MIRSRWARVISCCVSTYPPEKSRILSHLDPIRSSYPIHSSNLMASTTKSTFTTSVQTNHTVTAPDRLKKEEPSTRKELYPSSSIETLSKQPTVRNTIRRTRYSHDNSQPTSFPPPQPQPQPQPQIRQAQEPKSIPTLKEFLHWKRVLQMYRKFLKLVKQYDKDPSIQQSIQSEIRSSFRKQKRSEDPFHIQLALKEGEVQYQQLVFMIHSSKSLNTKNCNSSSTIRVDTDGHMKKKKDEKSLEENMRMEEVRIRNVQQHEENQMDSSASSWMDIQDKDDVRGRVGLEWPWMRSESGK